MTQKTKDAGVTCKVWGTDGSHSYQCRVMKDRTGTNSTVVVLRDPFIVGHDAGSKLTPMSPECARPSMDYIKPPQYYSNQDKVDYGRGYSMMFVASCGIGRTNPDRALGHANGEWSAKNTNICTHRPPFIAPVPEHPRPQNPEYNELIYKGAFNLALPSACEDGGRG